MRNVEKLAFRFGQNFPKFCVFVRMASGMRKKVQNLFGWTHQASETAKFVRTASTSRQGLFREEPYKLDTSGKPILINLQTHYPQLPFLGPFAALLPKL